MSNVIRTLIYPAVLGASIAACSGGGGGTPATPEELRSRTIHTDLVAIDNQAAAQGGWASWVQRLQTFRASAEAKLQEVDLTGFAAFLGEDDFLFTRVTLQYVLTQSLLYSQAPPLGSEFSPAYLTIVDLNRQLRARGIDLIVVPAPTRAELYPDRYSQDAPDGIPVTPQRYEMIQALLEADVEVVDLLPMFTRMRDVTQPELYLQADGHWSSRGIALAAQELAWRVGRYPLAAALDAHDYTTAPVPAPPIVSFETLLPPHVAETYEAPPIVVQQVRDESGAFYQDVPDGPVLIVGDSYVGIFANLSASLTAHLAIHIGFPTTSFFVPGGGPAVPVFLADMPPEFVNSRRVIVWVFAARFWYKDVADRWISADLP